MIEEKDVGGVKEALLKMLRKDNSLICPACGGPATYEMKDKRYLIYRCEKCINEYLNIKK